MSRLILFFALLCPAAAAGGSDGDGARLFALHCAACHGRDATGAGAMAEVLQADPADLAGLSLRNGGRFPTEAVVAKIDGRIALPAHGGTMPVYGWFFDGPLVEVAPRNGASARTTEAIAALVRWLAENQR